MATFILANSIAAKQVESDTHGSPEPIFPHDAWNLENLSLTVNTNSLSLQVQSGLLPQAWFSVSLHLRQLGLHRIREKLQNMMHSTGVFRCRSYGRQPAPSSALRCVGPSQLRPRSNPLTLRITNLLAIHTHLSRPPSTVHDELAQQVNLEKRLESKNQRAQNKRIRCLQGARGCDACRLYQLHNMAGPDLVLIQIHHP